MNQSNIEKFNIYSGKILALLLSNFPIPTDISVLKDIIADPQASSKELEFVAATIRALRRYGFIDYEDELIGGDEFLDVCLTLKALEVLKATPKALQNSKSIGDYLLDSVKLSKDEAIKNGVNLAFSQGAILFNALLGSN